MKDLEILLNKIYSSKILDYNIDFLNDSIFFELEIFNKRYKVFFEEVFSYFYNKGTIESRNEILKLSAETIVQMDDEEEGFLEADHIYYLPKGIRDKIKIIDGNKAEK